MPAYPTPRPLPTLPPNTQLPQPTALLPTLAPLARPLTIAATPVAQATPVPGFIPIASGQSPTPAPTPSAFAQTNVFVYGQPPPNSYANPMDPVKIFYASFTPTVLFNGASATLTAITTTNVNTPSLGIDGNFTQITPVAPGKWQMTYAFSTAAVSPGQTNVTLTLTAYRGDGQTASIQIPVSVVH